MMTLSKALKVKNRLLGEYNKLQEIVRNNNTRRVDSGEKTINVGDSWNELLNLNSKIIELKAKIAVATAPIAPYLIDLAETKAMIAFLNSLPIKEGNEDTVIGYGASASVKTVKWESTITLAGKNTLVKNYERHLDNLQDKIDEFNATTKIDFS